MNIQNKILLKKHKNLIKTLDICIILILVLSFSTLIITNSMVAKKDNIVYKEGNPITSTIHGFEQHPNWWKLMLPYLVHTLFLGFLFGHYLWIRNTATKIKHLKWFTYAYGFVTIFIAYDFFNDFGYLIGGII